MPLGIVNNQDFEAELVKPGVRPQSTIINLPDKGRGETLEVPDMIRSIVGEDALENGSRATLSEGGLAKYLGISPSSVSAYKNGSTSTSTYDKPEPKLNERIGKRKRIIVGKASKVLNESLSHLNDGRLVDSKPVELSQIARNMAGIIKDMEPAEKKEISAAAQIIIYKPAMQFNESKYETVHLGE